MIRNSLRIPNLFWYQTQSDAIQAILSGCPPTLVLGQFAVAHETDSHIFLIRDRLGLNKLFYYIDSASRQIFVGNYLWDIATATRDLNRIYSVPAGHYLKIDKSTFATELKCYYAINDVVTPDPSFSLSEFKTVTDRKLTEAFKFLSRNYSDAQFVVALSGGLDSSVVAHYGKRFLPNLTAVTFSTLPFTDDFKAAARIAEALKIPHLPVVQETAIARDALDKVLLAGQDWRDFNVHCAWVNREIAKNLSLRFPDKKIVLLTGDLMNEFIADYQPVNFKGATYYAPPKVSRSQMRRFYTYGLDAGDREIGVFHESGITTVQVYSLLAEHFLSIPGDLLDQPNAKQVVNLPLIENESVNKLILKNKLRAQVGGECGGVLGLFHKQNIGQEQLQNRWNELFAPYCNEEAMKSIIARGRYRSC